MPDQSNSTATLTAILGAAATALLAYNTWTVSQFDSQLREVESERELNFRIYQSIAESIESGNPQRIRAVRALVEALADGDLRKGFINALDSGEVEIYESQEAAAPPVERSTGAAPTDWGEWDYDVFWCSSSGARAQNEADAIVAALRDEGARGRIRSRVLPDSIRKTDDYQSKEEYEVRFEANEQDAANAVSALAKRTLNRGEGFHLRKITPKKATPWYVSVFVCPERAETAEG